MFSNGEVTVTLERNSDVDRPDSPSKVSTRDNSSGNLSILQEVFSHLTITEKCALAISLSRSRKKNSVINQVVTSETINEEASQKTQVSDREQTQEQSNFLNRSRTASDDMSSVADSNIFIRDRVAVNMSFDSEVGPNLNSSGLEDDRLELEMQSVVSEQDREQLDVVMRMMGDLELHQVENEVKS
jgi:hypothetical protein